MTTKSYNELKNLETFEERFEYLMLKGSVGRDTFGPDRVFNQKFYQSREWREFHDYILARDQGLDLGVEPTHPRERLIVHHIVPITMDDILNQSDRLLDPNNAITVTHRTHNALHFSDDSLLKGRSVIERTPDDTCPWKKGGR